VEKSGDVLLTLENDTLREVAEADVEIVYPPASILAEPYVAWRDAHARQHSLWPTPRHGWNSCPLIRLSKRSPNSDIAPSIVKSWREFSDRLPPLNLFPVTLAARDWDDVQQKFFGENGIIDTVYMPKPKPAPLKLCLDRLCGSSASLGLIGAGQLHGPQYGAQGFCRGAVEARLSWPNRSFVPDAQPRWPVRPAAPGYGC
jgi:hypothetical protein